MNGRIRAYTVVALAYRSYDVLLDGIGLGLGIYRDVAPRRSAPVRKSTRAAPKYRAVPSSSDRYHCDFWQSKIGSTAKTVGLNSLTWRGYTEPTGRTDEEGRAEWMITDAGRAALAKDKA